MKLIRVVSGNIFDVAVDLKKSLANVRPLVRFKFSASNKLQIYIPSGFGHDFAGPFAHGLKCCIRQAIL